MENCCDSMLKYLIFIFNFFLFMSGVALISMGAYIQIEMSDYLNFLDDSYLNSSVLFIALGIVILVIGFCGCCGAVTENACMMFTFATLLALVVMVEIGAAIAIYLFKNEAHDLISQNMVEGMAKYNTDPNSEYAGVTETWNIIQTDFKCCGVKEYSDWETTNFAQGTDVPDSCCKVTETGCGKGILEASPEERNSTINVDGCFQRLEHVVIENVEVVMGAGAAIIFIQIIGVLVSCMLAANMRRNANYV